MPDPPKLSGSQLSALLHCVAMSSVEGTAAPWLDLAGLGLHRTTIRALERAGLIQPMDEGWAGQLIGQRYRITQAGRDTIAGERDRHSASEHPHRL
jgi:hypothetical protein